MALVLLFRDNDREAQQTLFDIHQCVERPFHLMSTSGIFLLYEGLPPNVIESQVLSHVQAMAETGIQMEVWTFALKQQSYADACTALPHLRKDFPITIRVFHGFSPSLPFSDWLNALLLFWWMRRLDAHPQFIRARTERATAIAATARRFRNFRLIWDARGDAVSELKVETVQHHFAWRWLISIIKKRIITKRLNLAAKNCDAAIFVSEALQHLQGYSLPLERTLVVPCVADERLFYYSPELRAEARSIFNYQDKDQVIIYVGSTAPWQCIPETVSLMNLALRANPAFKALIVTPNIKTFESMFPDELRDRVRFISGTLKEINHFLNAADFGMLLRKQDAINKVASPVKFAEYSLTGLTVVTGNAIDQVTTLGQKLNNVVNEDAFLSGYVNGHNKLENRSGVAFTAQQLLAQAAYMDVMAKFYMNRF